MTTDANLKIVRHRGYADLLRSYKIFVNDEQVGTINRNAVLNREVSSGRLKIEARIDWGRSAPLMVDAAPGQTITIEVSNRWNPLLALWAITFGARAYLELKEIK